MFAALPVPTPKPHAINSTKASTFSVASRLLTNRPGPTPRRWTKANPQISARAITVCAEKESAMVPGTIGIEKNGVVFPAAGANRAR